jgi:hypothetical protein
VEDTASVYIHILTLHTTHSKETPLTSPQEGDPKPKSYAQANASVANSDGASSGVGLYAVVLVGAALAFGAYKYLQAQQGEQ